MEKKTELNGEKDRIGGEKDRVTRYNFLIINKLYTPTIYNN